MKNVLLLMSTLVMGTTANVALAITLYFDNNDVDLGTSTAIDVTNEYYTAFGISITDAYRYIDSRDPFVDPYPSLDGNFGLSNGTLADIGIATTGRIDFGNNTSYFSADWWTIEPNTIYVEAFDSSDTSVGFIASNGTSGTVNINGDISYITWHNNGGFVQLANISYDGLVPIPAAVWLFGSGLMCLVGIARRKKA